jgi:hypothetical protein
MQSSSKTNRECEEEKRENTVASSHLEVAHNEGREKRERKNELGRGLYVGLSCLSRWPDRAGPMVRHVSIDQT